MNWLITGGCGFIGTSLVERLLKGKNNNIRIVDNLKVGQNEDLLQVCQYCEVKANMPLQRPEGVQLIVADILDDKIAINATQDIDVIVHLAANTGVGPSVQNPKLDLLTNVIGTFNYLESARINNVGRFIFASSGAPVGEVTPPIHEEIAPHPVSPYGASKLSGEGYCSAYHKSYGIGTIALRFGNVYGPRSNHKSSVVAKFIKDALDGKELIINGSGKQTRDFIYIDDLVDVILRSARLQGVTGQTFQIATGIETCIEEVAAIIVKKLHMFGIYDIVIKHTESRIGDVMRNYSDTTKAKKMLKWESMTNLEKGIERTISYFIKTQL